MKIITIKSEALVIASIAAIWIIIMSQFKPLTDSAVWLVPTGIVGVYIAFELWNYLQKVLPAPGKNRNQKQTVLKLTKLQNVVQTFAYVVISMSTTMLLKASFDWFNNWHIIGVGLVCFFAVTWVFQRFFWSKRVPKLSDKVSSLEADRTI
ncbi:MAG: hypothetical protein CML22_06675 [Rheinheimera sp.]|nr:hypothetical protein [Rheinheimera sp.]MBM33966.1 hypothetical protein [Rheinheimera sp.]